MRSGPGGPLGFQLGQLCDKGSQAINLQLQALRLIIVLLCHRASFGAFQLREPRGCLGVCTAAPVGCCY